MLTFSNWWMSQILSLSYMISLYWLYSYHAMPISYWSHVFFAKHRLQPMSTAPTSEPFCDFGSGTPSFRGRGECKKKTNLCKTPVLQEHYKSNSRITWTSAELSCSFVSFHTLGSALALLPNISQWRETLQLFRGVPVPTWAMLTTVGISWKATWSNVLKVFYLDT